VAIYVLHLLQSLEESIHSRFIPAITGRDPPYNLIRDLLALPTRLGGMGLVNPATLASVQYNASLRVAEPLKNAILEQDGLYSSQCWKAQMDAKKAVHNENRERIHNSSSALRQRVPPPLSKQSHQLCTGERGVQLAHCPPSGGGQFTTQGGLQRCNRYGWQPISIQNVPVASFTVEHALLLYGRFPTTKFGTRSASGQLRNILSLPRTWHSQRPGSPLAESMSYIINPRAHARGGLL